MLFVRCFTVISEKRFTRFLSIALACCASLPFWLAGRICVVERQKPCKSFFGNDCTVGWVQFNLAGYQRLLAQLPIRCPNRELVSDHTDILGSQDDITRKSAVKSKLGSGVCCKKSYVSKRTHR